jgi:uncharacterized protein (UPF0333 family)
MLDIAIAIVVLAILVASWGLVKRSAAAAEQAVGVAVTAIEVVATTSEDSMKTYSRDITIINAKKRVEQKKEIDKMDDIPTDAELDDLLAGIKG